MLEGQDGLTWDRWRRFATAAEDLGFAGLFRSDHFTNPTGPHTDALDLWASLTWLASNTRRIAFGQMVSPVSFRHPVITAWTAAAISDLSGGRFRLGLGAGWQEREHTSFGFDLLSLDDRFARFEEALEVTSLLLRSDEPVAFTGRFYTLSDALLLPRPAVAGQPPIVIGGNGPKRTLPLVAKYADEWNATSLPMEDYRERMRLLDELLEERGRKPEDVKRTVMRRGVIGVDDVEVKQKLDGADKSELLARGLVIGTPGEAVEILGTFADAGVDGVMLQWMDMDDISGLELVAAEVLPHVR